MSPSDDEGAWVLRDLLGRSMGRVVAAAPDRFVIDPENQAIETMAGIHTGPFASLDLALAEIEKQTRGTCRRNPGEDQGAAPDPIVPDRASED